MGEKINLLSTGVAAISESDTGSSISVTEEEAEYDLSSDEEICAGECFVEEESGLGNQQVTRDFNFLLGQHPYLAVQFGSIVNLFHKTHA